MSYHSTASEWLTYGAIWERSGQASRTIFTTIFIVLNFCIAFIGGRLIKRQAQRSLLKNNPVPLTKLVPWLSLGSIASYIWDMRTMPGGYFGFLMIISGGFNIVHQYFVSNYITVEWSSQRCDFEVGLVTTHRTAATRTPFTPTPSWPTAQLAFSAHGAATDNGGIIGVWSKINNNITYFCPDETDILGKWVCTKAADSVMQPSDWTSGTAVTAFNSRQGFLYKQASYRTGSVLPNGTWIAVMAWSADVVTNSTLPWTVRSTIAVPTDITLNTTASNFDCRLDNKNSTAWKPAVIDSLETLDAWSQVMMGDVLDIPASEYQGQLEKVLNTITMTAGSGNKHMWDVKKAEDTGAGNKYGCLAQRTYVANQIFATAFVLALLLFTFCVIDLYDFIRNMLDKRHSVTDRMPFDLLDWQLGHVQGMVGNENLEVRRLNDYEFYWCERTQTYRCRVMANKAGKYEPVENPQGNNSETTMGKTDGVVVSTQSVGPEMVAGTTQHQH